VIRTDARNPILADPSYGANLAIHSNLIPRQSRKKKNQSDVVGCGSTPAVLLSKPSQGFSMKYKTSDNDKESDNKGVKSALAIIER